MKAPACQARETGGAKAKRRRESISEMENWRAVGLAFPTVRSVGLGAVPVPRSKIHRVTRAGASIAEGCRVENVKVAATRRAAGPAGLSLAWIDSCPDPTNFDEDKNSDKQYEGNCRERKKRK